MKYFFLSIKIKYNIKKFTTLTFYLINLTRFFNSLIFILDLLTELLGVLEKILVHMDWL